MWGRGRDKEKERSADRVGDGENTNDKSRVDFFIDKTTKRQNHRRRSLLGLRFVIVNARRHSATATTTMTARIVCVVLRGSAHRAIDCYEAVVCGERRCGLRCGVVLRAVWCTVCIAATALTMHRGFFALSRYKQNSTTTTTSPSRLLQPSPVQLFFDDDKLSYKFRTGQDCAARFSLVNYSTTHLPMDSSGHVRITPRRAVSLAATLLVLGAVLWLYLRAQHSSPAWGVVEPSARRLTAGMFPWPERNASSPASRIDAAFDLGHASSSMYWLALDKFATTAFPPPLRRPLVSSLKTYRETHGAAWDIEKVIWQTDKDASSLHKRAVASWRRGETADEGWAATLLTNESVWWEYSLTPEAQLPMSTSTLAAAASSTCTTASRRGFWWGGSTNVADSSALICCAISSSWCLAGCTPTRTRSRCSPRATGARIQTCTAGCGSRVPTERGSRLGRVLTLSSAPRPSSSASRPMSATGRTGTTGTRGQ